MTFFNIYFHTSPRRDDFFQDEMELKCIVAQVTELTATLPFIQVSK